MGLTTTPKKRRLNPNSTETEVDGLTAPVDDEESPPHTCGLLLGYETQIADEPNILHVCVVAERDRQGLTLATNRCGGIVVSFECFILAVVHVKFLLFELRLAAGVQTMKIPFGYPSSNV